MSNDEMQNVLADELARFRTWSYAELAEAVEATRKAHDHLYQVERVAPDGTPYFMDFDSFWDDQPNCDVRVSGSLYAEPQRRLLGFICLPHCTDSFIMSPDGRFVGEDEKTAAS